MFKRFLIVICFGLIISPNVSADNPFAKSEIFVIDKDTKWKLDKGAGLATKSKAGKKGNHYHLRFDNKKLELAVSRDAEGSEPTKYEQLDIKDVRIDGKQSTLFRWCLNNQERHDRFLQQGLAVKSNVCVSNGSQGRFVMQLDKTTLSALKNATELSIVIKPFRTPLELQYDISDFTEMTVSLSTPDIKAAAAQVASAGKPVVNEAKIKRVCLSSPPGKYKSIQPIEYDCGDKAAKKQADNKIEKQVSKQKEIEEKQRRLAEEKKRQELAAAEAERLRQEELRQAEAAAVAASQAKQDAINSEIVAKMVAVCDKFWSKGEHRCYCQKYIEHAPGEIQSNNSCQ
jgi:hypothetical protein